MKTYVVGTQLNRLAEVVLMSTLNILHLNCLAEVILMSTHNMFLRKTEEN